MVFHDDQLEKVLAQNEHEERFRMRFSRKARKMTRTLR